MSIVKEHYRDFTGTLLAEIETLNNDIKALNQSDEIEYYEAQDIYRQIYYLESIHEHFKCEERWATFNSLEDLKTYVTTLKNTYDSMYAYSKAMLPAECNDLIGVTQEEWDKLEGARYRVAKSLNAWELFEQFCESGNI